VQNPSFDATLDPNDRVEVALVNPQPGAQHSLVAAVVHQTPDGRLQRAGSIQLFLTADQMLQMAVGFRDCSHEAEAVNRLARTDSEVTELAEVGG
jgi:hypothetical protein